MRYDVAEAKRIRVLGKESARFLGRKTWIGFVDDDAQAESEGKT